MLSFDVFPQPAKRILISVKNARICDEYSEHVAQKLSLEETVPNTNIHENCLCNKTPRSLVDFHQLSKKHAASVFRLLHTPNSFLDCLSSRILSVTYLRFLKKIGTCALCSRMEVNSAVVELFDEFRRTHGLGDSNRRYEGLVLLVRTKSY
jgi:hypothetical protein